MTLGLAINLTPPDTESMRLVLQGGMLAATLLVMALLGWPLLLAAGYELQRRRITMELLFLLGIVAAMAISVQSMIAGRGPVYFEVVSILLVVYSVGRAVNQYNRQKAASAMQSLTDQVRTARLVDGNTIDVRQIRAGDMVQVMPGELIPVDGQVVSGSSLIRQTAFTGEWAPVLAREGDPVLAGAACEDGSLLIRATADGNDRRVDRLAELIEAARRTPTSLQRQADRLVRWFLPTVLVVAAGSLIFWTIRQNPETGLFSALAVVLVACPCAAGLATPLAMWSALTTLAKRGLIVRGADAIERLAGVDGVIFDKTGTLSDEKMIVKNIIVHGHDRQRLLSLISAVERRSNHPVAKALASLSHNDDGVEVVAMQTIPGLGIEATIGDGSRLRIIRDDNSPPGELRLNVILNGSPATTIFLGESLRQSAQRTIRRLQQMGLLLHVMTGDSPAAASHIQQLAPTTAAMTPAQKHDAVLAMRNDPSAKMRRPLFVGDGINDAAAMAVSHASIALAGGAEIAVESASATLHGGDLTLIPAAIELSRRTVASIRSNLLYAVAYNVIGMTAAACGWLHPVLASVLMAASSALVGYRSLRTKKYEGRRMKDERKALRLDAFVHLPSVIHGVGIIGQAAILIPLARLSASEAALTILIAIIGWRLVARYAHRLSLWFDHILAMITIGGLGMNFGWWADMRFGSAIHENAMRPCCAMAAKITSHTLAAPTSYWMYAGMVLLGTPAMYLLRRQPEKFSWRRWCCIGPLIVGVPGMCLGMFGGALAAEQIRFLSPTAHVLAAYTLMMIGMIAGMLLPHAFEGQNSPPTA